MDEILTYQQKLKAVFKEHSFEILKFLQERDLYPLRTANKFVFDVIDCHLLFKDSVKQLDVLFDSIVELPSEPEKQKSKFCILFAYRSKQV